MNARKPFPKSYLLFPLLIACAVYLAGITTTDLWPPEEPSNAQVAREMLERGDYIRPYYNGEPHTEKPPLFFWTVMAGARVFGEVDSLAARLPSVLSALGTLALLIVFIGEFAGRRAAFLSAILLATSPEFFWLARFGRIDMMLTFLITASLVSFYRWHAGGERAYLAVFYACLSLAALAKGPVGMALPLLAALSFLVFRKEWRRMNKMRLYVGLPAAVAAVLAWYILAYGQSEDGGAAYVIFGQLTRTIIHPDGDAPSMLYRPFYHLAAPTWGMAPWSFLVPWAIVAAYRSRKDTPRLFLLCWGAAIFAFYALVASERKACILPVYPAAAALIALWVTRSPSSVSLKLIRMATGTYGAALLVIALTAIALAPGYVARAYPEVPLDFNNGLLPVWAGAGVVAIAAAFFSNRSEHVIGVCAGASLTTLAVVIASVLPWMNKYKSPRNLCSVFNRAKTADSEIAMFGGAAEEYVFYTDSPVRTINSRQDLRLFFDADRRMFCFVGSPDYNQALGEADFPAHVVAKQRVNSCMMLLLCNQNVRSYGASSARAIPGQGVRDQMVGAMNDAN